MEWTCGNKTAIIYTQKKCLFSWISKQNKTRKPTGLKSSEFTKIPGHKVHFSYVPVADI